MAAALDRLGSGLDTGASAFEVQLRGRVLAAWDAVGFAGIAGEDPRRVVQRVAGNLGLPPAVVRRLLESGKRFGLEPSQAVRFDVPTATPAIRRAPDWSYQDDACRAALRSLRADPNRKAGLVIFPMTHEFMAVMLGVRRPGVSLAAGVLQKAGLIRYARGRMAVTDRPGLEAAACECHCIARREFARLLGPGPAKPPAG